jgi:hypothetical protein
VKGGKWRRLVPFKGGVTAGKRGPGGGHASNDGGVPGSDRWATLGRQRPGADGRGRAACLAWAEDTGGGGGGPDGKKRCVGQLFGPGL